MEPHSVVSIHYWQPPSRSVQKCDARNYVFSNRLWIEPDPVPGNRTNDAAIKIQQ
uniref:Uncharacterized protein n=1 Tax=Pseudomonas aeruginosa TaxID=287 RepID=A0A7S6G640_PSEAI|nr:hypothetical protein [Pseudomonas aeruginosa]